MAQRRLTRDQIAKIVNNDPEAIRAFEDLFRQATADQPAELVTLRADVDGLALDPAGIDALEALSWASRIQDRLDRFAYAEILKTADQVAGAINTAEAITWNNATIARGVILGSPASRIVVARRGTYKFDLSVQLSSSSGSHKNIWLWFAINGTPVANSAIIETEALNNGFASVSRTEFFELEAGDYVECMFAVDDLALTLNAEAATAFAPAAPAALLAVAQVAP
jgi:hypothetical protein